MLHAAEGSKGSLLLTGGTRAYVGHAWHGNEHLLWQPLSRKVISYLLP